MNDEIKEILQKIENVANRETASRNALMEMKDTDYQLLLDYITNLQQKVEQYENPEDLTLFYMWLDEKAKDKMKELQSRIDRALGYIYQYREVYYPDDPQSEPIISYNLGIYEEEFDEEKIVNILKGDSE